MKIVIDYNSDRVMINPDDRYYKYEVEYTKADMKNPLLFVQDLLKDIFDRIEPSINTLPVQYTSLNIELEKFDEDRVVNLGGW